ncbi:MAG: hypothetical protein A2942_00990 [Candidatus Lloydbacteria bacterium RIFCSPLOWO2_01_FULL_50_20]|uniref:Uncharacterized protein n=1 Tax=Candidatus Lloydbacteria bacterium RIFCSPLOWO2_01_FULL_50_20 TaxID=1798665 RepID=A0A1G2DKR8_9BACT|nr:MAG: hypothetical protein A2942_00990 [Candidatus Lloydbacteria bacterium RIFCSPLOWO2_01_FULL_50_20]
MGSHESAEGLIRSEAEIRDELTERNPQEHAERIAEAVGKIARLTKYNQGEVAKALMREGAEVNENGELILTDEQIEAIRSQMEKGIN